MMKLFSALFKRKEKSVKLSTALPNNKEVVETVEHQQTNKIDVIRSINNTVHKEYNFTEYEYLEECPQDIFPSKQLVEKLPAPSKIQIISFSNASKSIGKRCSIGMNNIHKEENFIQYRGKRLDDVTSEEKNNNVYSIFKDSFHPFLQNHTNNISGCAEIICQSFSCEPSTYEITTDALNVKLDGGYHHVSYEETVDFICYKQRYQESYHDGGGSGSRIWCIYAASDIECKVELSEEIEYKACSSLPGFMHLPYCRGYWEENGHMYLVDPWGLSGIFEYYCHAEECRDWSSDKKVWKIGIPYDNKV